MAVRLPSDAVPASPIFNQAIGHIPLLLGISSFGTVVAKVTFNDSRLYGSE
jgi:hypothetical protein